MKIPEKKRYAGKYDPALKIAIAREYFTTDQGYDSLAKKYNIAQGTIPSFIRWYQQRYPDGSTEQQQQDATATSSQNKDLQQAPLKIEALELQRLCTLFGKTRQAYYDHYWRQSDEQLQEALIVELVRSIRQRLPKLGARKLLLVLQEDFSAHHISIGRDRFLELLRKHELLVRRTKRYVRTTDSNHPFKKWPDLIKELPPLTATEQLWVSDITYLRTESGFVYLSLITDAYSHKIVGYHLSQHLKAQGCILALNKAIATLKGTEEQRTLIHHSDRGVQYCCDAYVQVLQHHHIAISMTQSGSPYDNAMAERVNGILKSELLLEQTFSSYSAAVAVVHQAVDAYNRLRPHMSCGNLTPEQVHQQQQPTALKMMWKSKPRTVKLNPYYCE